MFSQRFGSVHSGSAGGVISHSSQRFGGVIRHSPQRFGCLHSGSAGGVTALFSAFRVRPQRFGSVSSGSAGGVISHSSQRFGCVNSLSGASPAGRLGGELPHRLGAVPLAVLMRPPAQRLGGWLNDSHLSACSPCWGTFAAVAVPPSLRVCSPFVAARESREGASPFMLCLLRYASALRSSLLGAPSAPPFFCASLCFAHKKKRGGLGSPALLLSSFVACFVAVAYKGGSPLPAPLRSSSLRLSLA